MLKKAFILLLILFAAQTHQARENLWSDYYIQDENRIVNDQTLQPFFQKLDSMLSRRSGKVNVLHIGDSHIQADYFSGQMRYLMQSTFGNGGRGFVFPYQIAKSNGPTDIGIEYEGGWASCNIMKGYEGKEIGACGYTLFAEDSADFILRLKPQRLNTSFNKITVFQDGGALLPMDSIQTRAVALGGLNYFPFSTYLMEAYHDSMRFMAHVDGDEPMKIQGISLENGEAGIVYHSMGTNGSSTLHYLRSNAFEKQIAVLKTDLVILSFGTNDAYLPYSRYCSSCAKDRFRQMIYRIRKHNPNACILITAPPDHFYRRRYDNRNLYYLRRSLEKLAMEENVAFWDLYTIMGGERSILSWQRAGLARGDLIHFSKEGYKLQGTLLFEAIMNSYDGRFN